jgi:LuxR family transcriptional regulator of spore coat protein
VSDTPPKFRRFLSNREREVFELLVQNKTTKEIAAQLFISEKTVRNHISNVMQKLQVKGRSQAVVELIRLEELKI